MDVRATRRFHDLKADVIREAGDEFEVTKKRFEELNSTKYQTLVEPVEVPEADAEEPETPEDAASAVEVPEADAEEPEKA